MFDLNIPKLELITERFTGKDQSIVKNALSAFHAGYSHSLGGVLETFKFVDSKGKGGHQVVMNGNEAIAYGLIAAGVRFGAGYPITPWSDIMELLRRELPKYGGTFMQTEDEIAAISMAIGGSYAGRVAVTGSSGPGISLKTEALGWAVMAEMPLVIIDVQRGGPSTGMPTNIEQSDLNIACFGGHGDSPRVVIAPADVEDCFYSAIEAVNIAKRYSVPVILLTDQGIATRIEAFTEPNLEKSVRTSLLISNPSPITNPRSFGPDGIAASPARHRGFRAANIRSSLVSNTTNSGPSNRLAEVAHADDGEAPQKLQALARRCRRRKFMVRPKAMCCWSAGVRPRPDQGSGRSRPRRRRQCFVVAHQASQSVAARRKTFSAGFNQCLSSDERRRSLRLQPARRLLRSRYCDPKIRGINKTDGLTFKVKKSWIA